VSAKKRATARARTKPKPKKMPIEPDMVQPLRPRKPGRAWTNWFGEGVEELAEKDRRVMALTAAMPDGTGLMQFRDKFPERFVDAGIAEQHCIAFASGLAVSGLRPVAAIYSTFLQRGYDQVFQEVALQNLPVTFMLDRAGLAGPDGPTHHGVFDLGYMRLFPNMVVMAPGDGWELGQMLELASQLDQPSSIRYPKAAADVVAGERAPVEASAAQYRSCSRRKAPTSS